MNFSILFTNSHNLKRTIISPPEVEYTSLETKSIKKFTLVEDQIGNL